MQQPTVLLIGPYDPHCGEYTFLAPPLGVWRLAGVLESAGVPVKVFDPNCCTERPDRALEREILSRRWDIIGVSTTGMTLRFDLELAHLARRLAPRALLIAGAWRRLSSRSSCSVSVPSTESCWARASGRCSRWSRD